MTEPTDAEIKDLYAQETGFILDDSPAALLDFARAVLAKWGTPPAVAREPVAWLSTDCIGERYLCFTKPKDSNPARPLVFGDTTPHPAQALTAVVNPATAAAIARRKEANMTPSDHGQYSGVVDIARNGIDEVIRLKAQVKQDETLILQLVEALEKADKISGYPNNRKTITAGRARLGRTHD